MSAFALPQENGGRSETGSSSRIPFRSLYHNGHVTLAEAVELTEIEFTNDASKDASFIGERPDGLAKLAVDAMRVPQLIPGSGDRYLAARNDIRIVMERFGDVLRILKVLRVAA